MSKGSRSENSPVRGLGHPVLAAFSIVLTPALWILFVASTSWHELLVGLLASGATVVFGFFVCKSSSTKIAIHLRDLVQCWRIPWYILSGASEITLVLIKDMLHLAPAENLFRVCGFDSSTHDPVRVARSIMAVAYTTTAPNFIVVGIDPSQSRMLFHQIAPSSVPLMTKALGAKS